MARSSGSTVVRRRLGKALRGLREDANIRIEAAARELECSTAKVSRLENGLGPAKNVEVRALLDLYGVSDDETRGQFDDWASKTKAEGWWEEDGYLVDEDTDRHVSLETESAALRIFCTPVVPTLLQTPDYAFAHIRERHPGISLSEARRMADLRHARQEQLLGPSGNLQVTAIIDEVAVRRVVGGPAVHARQLDRLAEILDAPHTRGSPAVSVRVFPFERGTPDRALSPFVLFTPREIELDPVTALVEDTVGTRWYDTPDTVDLLANLFERLLVTSLDADGSKQLVLMYNHRPVSDTLRHHG